METYLTFLAFAVVLALAPGPDTFLTLRASVVGGRRRGFATIAGISVGNIIQGTCVALGLGAVLAHSEPVFLAIRWAGVAYLVWLGASALRDAFGRDGSTWVMGGAAVGGRKAFRQGFLCNITNPKVLAFNLAVLPQFVSDGQGFFTLMLYAQTLVVVGVAVLLVVVWLGSVAARHLTRPRFRRALDGATGVVMLGFATALAVEA